MVGRLRPCLPRPSSSIKARSFESDPPPKACGSCTHAQLSGAASWPLSFRDKPGCACSIYPACNHLLEGWFTRREFSHNRNQTFWNRQNCNWRTGWLWHRAGVTDWKIYPKGGVKYWLRSLIVLILIILYYVLFFCGVLIALFLSATAERGNQKWFSSVI